MSRLKRLSGKEVIAAFHSHGFIVVGQKGSHVKIRRFVSGQKQTLTIPDHPEIDTGTLRAIMRQAAAYLTEPELHDLFLTE